MRERCRARDFGGSTCYKLPREDVVEDAESLTLFGIQVCAECVGLGPHGATTQWFQVGESHGDHKFSLPRIYYHNHKIIDQILRAKIGIISEITTSQGLFNIKFSTLCGDDRIRAIVQKEDPVETGVCGN